MTQPPSPSEREPGADIVIPSAGTLAGIGARALSGNPNLVGQTAAGRTLELTQFQGQVLVLASLGGTTRGVADILSRGEEDIVEVRDELIVMYAVPNMAAVVDQACARGFLPFKLKEDPTLRLNPQQHKLLRLIAEGYTNADIRRELTKESGRPIRKSTMTDINDRLFRKTGSGGRTHSVRRSYELGIRKSQNAKHY